MFNTLLFIVLFGVLILISIVVLIVGIVKKKQSIIIGSAVLFIAGISGVAYTTYLSARKTVDYVRSEKFQNDASKGAELIGETIGSAGSGISRGLADGLDEAAIEKLAHKSAGIIGSSVKTMASGLDSTLGNKNIFLDKTMEDVAIKLGRAEEKSNNKKYDLEINIDYQSDFNGKLRVTNFDQNGKIIERVDNKIIRKTGDNKVEVFTFSHSNLGITTYYILSKIN